MSNYHVPLFNLSIYFNFCSCLFVKMWTGEELEVIYLSYRSSKYRVLKTTWQKMKPLVWFGESHLGSRNCNWQPQNLSQMKANMHAYNHSENWARILTVRRLKSRLFTKQLIFYQIECWNFSDFFHERKPSVLAVKWVYFRYCPIFSRVPITVFPIQSEPGLRLALRHFDSKSKWRHCQWSTVSTFWKNTILLQINSTRPQTYWKVSKNDLSFWNKLDFNVIYFNFVVLHGNAGLFWWTLGSLKNLFRSLDRALLYYELFQN